MKSLKFKYLKLKRREESDREIVLFMVIAALCGWLFSGWWIWKSYPLERPPYAGVDEPLFPFFFWIKQHEVVMYICIAGFMGWLFSLFFRKRRGEAGILCGVVFLLVSVIWSRIAGYR